MEHAANTSPALLALQEGPLGQFMRTSPVAYPLAEVLHIMGFVLLVGAIVGLDLRLLGVARGLPIAPLAALLRPLSIGGFVLAVGMGVLLFAADATHVANNPAFQVKLPLIALAVLNLAVLHFGAWRRVAGWGEAVPGAARAAALLSILLWLGVIAAGRLIAYF